MWKRIKGIVEEKILEEPSSTDIISKNARSVLMGLFSLLGFAIIFMQLPFQMIILQMIILKDLWI